MSKRYYVISYDISDDKKREMMANLLERYGKRVQKSVFECYIDERVLLEIKKRASLIIDMETDSVRFYLLCRRCMEAIEFIGKTPSLDEGDIDII